MLSYEKWKMLNESLGRANALGITSVPKIGGIISNMGMPTSANEGWEDSEMPSEDDDMEDKSVDLGDYGDESGEDHPAHHASHSSHSSHEEDGEDEDFGDEDMDDEDMGDEDMDDQDDGSDDDMDDEDGDEDHESFDGEESEDDGSEEDVHAELDSDGEGDEVEKLDVKEKPSMGMGENKKLPKHMLSESDWWASVKNMVGHVEPNGKIVNELLKLDGDNSKFDPKHITGSTKRIAAMFDKFLVDQGGLDNLTLQGAYDAFEEFVKPIMEVLLDKFGKSDGNIKTKIADMLKDIHTDEKSGYQTADPK